MVADMGVFVAKKVEDIRGKPTGICAVSGGAIAVPQNAPCRANAHLGGTHTFKAANSARGVEVTIVYASHANNVPRSLLSESVRNQLAGDNVSIALGPPTGYVVKFTNGLVAYLSGDTGIHSEMKTIVHDFHKANLAVLNLGVNPGIYISAGYAVNELLRPESVILTHVNEPATEGGKLRPKSKTAAVTKQLRPDAYLAISGRTMEFDGEGRCVSGC